MLSILKLLLVFILVGRLLDMKAVFMMLYPKKTEPIYLASVCMGGAIQHQVSEV